MGMDFSYKLYFRRSQIWDVLQGVIDIAEPHQPPASIYFPDHTLSIPVDTWGLPDRGIHSDDAEILFALVLNFDEDEAIMDYLRRNIKENDHRSPPAGEKRKIPIGYIYLTIHQSIPDHPDSDWVLFDFGTPGTSISILIHESQSIRNTFRGLAQKYHSACAVFNGEDWGTVFWLNGHDIPDTEIEDPFLLPEEIATLLGE